MFNSSSFGRYARAGLGASFKKTAQAPGARNGWDGMEQWLWAERTTSIRSKPSDPDLVTDTARDLRYFSQDTGTSQQRMARHDQSRVACVGWSSSDLPTAIAPHHPIRVARLGSCLKARAKSSARVSDRALALNVEMASSKVKSWVACNLLCDASQLLY